MLYLERMLRSLAKYGLIPAGFIHRLASRREIRYVLANASEFYIPPPLQDYPRLKDVLPIANQLGCEIHYVPHGWFANFRVVAMTYFHNRKTYVFIEDRFDDKKDYDRMEFVDTILHELVHATGAPLGRVVATQCINPTSSLYWHEEAIAMVGAQRLAAALNLPRLLASSPSALDHMLIATAEEQGGTTLDRKMIIEQVNQATQLVLQTPTT